MPPPPPDKIKFKPPIPPERFPVILTDRVAHFFPSGKADEDIKAVNYKYVKSQSVKGVYYIFPDVTSDGDVQSIVARLDFERSKVWKTPTGKKIYDVIEQRSDLVAEYSKAAPWDYRVAKSSHIKLPDDAVVGVHIFTTDPKNKMKLLYCDVNEGLSQTGSSSKNFSESNLDLETNIAQSEFLNYDDVEALSASGSSEAEGPGINELITHEDIHVSKNITGYDCATPGIVSDEDFFNKALEHETQHVTAEIAYEHGPRMGSNVDLQYPKLETEFPGPYLPSSDPDAVGLFLGQKVTRTQTDFIRRVSNRIKHGRPETPTLDETRTLSVKTPSSIPDRGDFFEYIHFNNEVLGPINEEIEKLVWDAESDLDLADISDFSSYDVSYDKKTGDLKFQRTPPDPTAGRYDYANTENLKLSEAQSVLGEPSDPDSSLASIQKKVQGLVKEIYTKREEFSESNPIQKYISEDPDLQRDELSWFGSDTSSSVECVPSSGAGPGPHPMLFSTFAAVGGEDCAGYVDTLPDERPRSDNQIDTTDSSGEESGTKKPAFTEDDYANMSSDDQDVVKTMGSVGRGKSKVQMPNTAVTEKLEGLMNEEDKALMNSVEASGNAVREAVSGLDALEGAGFALGAFMLFYDIADGEHNGSVDGWKVCGDIVGFIPVVGQFGQMVCQGIDMAVHGDKNTWDWAGLMIPAIGFVRTWISNWKNLHPYKAVVTDINKISQQVLKETTPPKLLEAALDLRLQHAEDYLQVTLDMMASKFDYSLKRYSTSDPVSVMDLMLLRGPLRNLTLELEHSQDFRILQTFQEVFQHTQGFHIVKQDILHEGKKMLWDIKQIAIANLPFHTIEESKFSTEKTGYNGLFTADTMQKSLDNVATTLDTILQVTIEKNFNLYR